MGLITKRVAQIDIEVFAMTEDGVTKPKYLCHGDGAILWANDLHVALKFLKEQICLIEEKMN